MRKRILTFSSRVLISGLIMGVVLEVALRLLGYPVAGVDERRREFTFMQLDSAMGWKPVPGAFRAALHNGFPDSMAITINPASERITRPLGSPAGSQDLLAIGGSFLMGYGLDNDQTALWQLQAALPGWNVRNAAVGAYGTYQSLLVLENQLAQGLRPQAVIYGLIHHHRMRNIAQSHWLEAMYRYQNEQNPTVPYVSLNEQGQLQRERPTRLHPWPGVRYSVLLHMVQRTLLRVQSWGREAHADTVTQGLLMEMQARCQALGIPFYVAVLYYPQAEWPGVERFFQEQEIAYIDCNVPLSHENTIRNDGHPVASVNAEWARRMLLRLRQDGVVDAPFSLPNPDTGPIIK